MLRKKVIIELPFVYTINEFSLGDQIFIAAGSEQNYPAYLVNPENYKKTLVSDGPGGMMSIMPVPGWNNSLVSVMGLFPPFIGFEAGIYLHTLRNGAWSARKVLSLPFSHRCEILTYNGENHLFVASVSSYKENPGDWSKPGELYQLSMRDIESDNWNMELILDNVFRNHGMNKYVIGNKEVVCISGAEGIFSIQPGDKKKWQVTRLFDHEVSEFSFFDLDNDGADELITIEPFHGNNLNVYKNITGNWHNIYISPLSFGHGLSVGKFQNNNVIVVGNRRDSGSLELHKVFSVDRIEKTIIEDNAGPTQTKVFSYKNTDYIMSANQLKNEVALYN